LIYGFPYRPPLITCQAIAILIEQQCPTDTSNRIIAGMPPLLLSTDILNQTPDAEYDNLWSKLQAHKPIPSPYTVFTHGESTLANL
jgi:hypothetical protein